MGIIIPNMDMPKSCIDCELCVVDSNIDYAWCVVCEKEWSTTCDIPRNNKAKNCPLIPCEEKKNDLHNTNNV